MKYNKGFAPLILVAIIVGALVIGGGAYYIGKSKGEDKKVGENPNVENQVVDNSENTKGVDQVNKNIEKKEIKTQVNTNAGYQVEYPTNWIVNRDTNAPSETRLPADRIGTPPMFNSFEIVNIKGAVKKGSDFSMETNGSIIDVQVTHGINYSTINDLYKDGVKYGLSANTIQERLSHISNMNIGGQSLLTEYYVYVPGKGIPGQSYHFIYNGKSYTISCASGSDAQYNQDLKVFTDFVSSFKLLDTTEESSITKNDVTFQPAYLKAVYTKNSKNYIDVDYIQMFGTIEEEKKAAVEDGKCKDIITCDVYNNGYKRNTNPLIRTFEVSSSALINVYGIVGNVLFNNANGNNQTTSFDKFLSTISSSKIKDDYVRIDVKDGKVVKIVEPYQE